MQKTEQHFIGRSKELVSFTDWLNGPTTPWILYIHDAAERQEKKGGIGKTWLLRRYQELAQQICGNIAIVAIDFFNLTNRDRIAIAKRSVEALQVAYPQ